MVVVLLVFVLGAVTLAEGERIRVPMDQGVLIGGFTCTAIANSPADTSISTTMQFRGTDNITAAELNVSNFAIPAELHPGEVCAGPVTRALEDVERQGCTPGQVSLRSEPTLEQRAFNFVCSGGLSHVVTALGELSRGIVAETLVP